MTEEEYSFKARRVEFNNLFHAMMYYCALLFQEQTKKGYSATDLIGNSGLRKVRDKLIPFMKDLNGEKYTIMIAESVNRTVNGERVTYINHLYQKLYNQPQNNKYDVIKWDTVALLRNLQDVIESFENQKRDLTVLYDLLELRDQLEMNLNSLKHVIQRVERYSKEGEEEKEE